MKVIDKFLPNLHKAGRRVLLIGKAQSGDYKEILLNKDNGLGSQQYEDASTPTPPLQITLIGGRVPGGEVKVIDTLQDLLGYYLATKSPKSIENSVSLISGSTLNGGNCLNSTAQNTYQAGLRQVWL